MFKIFYSFTWPWCLYSFNLSLFQIGIESVHEIFLSDNQNTGRLNKLIIFILENWN